MKKLLLAVIAACTLLPLSAQYFTKEYGSASTNDRIADGTASVAGPVGHIMAGQTFLSQVNDLMLIRTDVTGTVGAMPFFQNHYRLLTPSGQPLNSIPAKVIQLTSGNIFVVGTYQNAAPTFLARGVYTAVFTPAGAVISVRGWQATATSTSAITAVSACTSAVAGDPTIYITGNIELAPYGAGLGAGIFGISINGNTNVVNWTSAYDLNLLARESAADIIASPYAAEVVIVGNYLAPAGDGATFMLRVASGTGVSLAANVYNYTGSNESVAAIALSSAAPVGFVICGTSNNASVINRVWVFKTNTTGAGITGNAFINTSNGSVATGTDVIQRQNTFGAFEFYVSATAATGTIGANDMLVFKLTNILGFVGQFTYGKPATNESSVEIAAFTDGFGIYGNTNSGTVTANTEGYVSKAYYNGVTACNATQLGGSRVTPALSVAGTTHTQPGTLVQLLPTFTLLGPVVTYPICNAAVVAGGNNARIAADNEDVAMSNVSVYPNPVIAGSSPLQIVLDTPAEGEVQLMLTDITGREVLVKTIVATEGENRYELALPDDIRKGVYILAIRGAGINDMRKILVE
ncbi:MAG: T9SS type A sorting domain-containing protein [Bacteroidia bacterium]|jgi:hypothetical protein|nr:T9SS type A sorting domain-containing protein [Bacteroidia bacterium]